MFKQLEEEKQRVIHLRIDLENEKKKAQADKEAAARMAQMQQATMEKQWKEKIANAEKEVIDLTITHSFLSLCCIYVRAGF